MSNMDSDNYVRCHQAIQLVCSKLSPCIQKVLETWHRNIQQTLSACTTPQTCPNKGKPKANKGSCKACVDWGNALELAIYPPNSSGTVSWSNINPTLLHNDLIEAAKVFVLRLQPGAVYSDVGDFDAASLLMIMIKFNVFHQGDQAKYDIIKKVCEVRNHLSHMNVNKDLKLGDSTTDECFKSVRDLVNCLSPLHPRYISQETARGLMQSLQDIRMSPVSQRLRDELLEPFYIEMEQVVRETIQDEFENRNKPPESEATSEDSRPTNIIDKFDVDTCRKELGRVYEDEKGKLSLLPFDVEGVVEIDDIFVNLELAEQSFFPSEVNSVSLKSHDDLFNLEKRKQDNKPVLRVLVKGGPGSGKTILTAKIAYDWAQGIKKKSWSGSAKFQLLFALNMRYVDHDMSLVDAIFDQLLPTDSEVSKCGLEKYILEHADQIAIILDGADEFSRKIAKSRQGNRIVDVICNKMLCSSCVIVTTRPHKVNHVREFNQYCHVEVNGFTMEGVLQFVGKFFQVTPYKSEEEFFENTNPNMTMGHDQEISEGVARMYDKLAQFGKSPRRSQKEFTKHADGKFNKFNTEDDKDTSKAEGEKNAKSVDSLLNTMYSSELLTSLAFVPVILTMLCLMWSETKKLPERVTLLYQEAVHYFTQRWLQKQSEEIDSEEMESNILTELGKVAISCLLQDRLFFTAREFQHPNILEKACSIGILVQERKRSRLHVVKQYVFFHKTFQEFCAASYWASLAEISSPKFAKYLSRITPKNVDAFENLLLFCCGLSERAAEKVLRHVTKIHARSAFFEGRCWFRLRLSVAWDLGIHLLHESQSPKLVRILIDQWFSAPRVDVWISNLAPKETLLYCDYFIDCFEQNVSSTKSNAYSTLIFEIPYVRMGSEFQVERTSKLAKCLLKNSRQLLKLVLNVRYDIDESIQRACQFMGSLSGLHFKQLQIMLDVRTSIQKTMFYTFRLTKQDGHMYAKVLKQLGRTIGQFSFPLALTILSDMSLDISHLLNSISRSTNITLMTEFRCITCTFSRYAIVSFISKLTTVKWLEFDQKEEKCEFDEKEVSAQKLQDHYFAKPLTSKSLLRLLQAIKSKSLEVLELYGIYLGSSTVHLQIEKLLEHLPRLTIQYAKMNREETKSFFIILSKGKVIQELCLKGNVIGGDTLTDPKSESCTVGYLAKTLKHLPILKLDLSYTFLLPQDVHFLSEGLLNLTNLESIDLSNNEIGADVTDLKSDLFDTGITALSRAFRHLHRIVHIDLSDNNISFKGVYELSRSLCHLPRLSFLVLSKNPIGDLGVLAICQYLESSVSQLERLDIDDCSITSTGALLLASSFTYIPNLKMLHIVRNSVGPQGIRWLFEKLHMLPQLVELSINDMSLPYEKCDELLKSCFEQIDWKPTKTVKGIQNIDLLTVSIRQIQQINKIFKT